MTEISLPHGDPDVAASHDLFRHVNGAWIDSFEIPDDRAGDGAMRELYDAAEEKVRDLITGLADASPAPGSEEAKIADLFTSFMDTERINELGVTPLAEGFERIKAAADHSELARLMGELDREGCGGLLGGFVSADAKDSDVYAMYIVQSGLHLPDESYYRGEDNAELREKFRAHIAKMSQLAGLQEHTGMTGEELAEKILAFETAVAEHHWDRVTSRDAEKTYNRFTVPEVADLVRGFDLDAWRAGAGIEHADYLIVSQPSFLTGAGQVWADTPVGVLRGWMIFALLNASASALSDEIVEENFDFFGRTLSGTPQLRERWKRGVSLVEGLLGEAVGKLYVAQEFPPEAKEAIGELVDKLIRAYESSITSLDWMGEETKGRALTKLSQFTPKVGYPDVWREYPAEIRADDLLGNIRRSAEAEHDRHVGRIGEEIDRNEWLMTPQTVNAYYHPVMNEIVFPAAILQPPFFDVDAPDAVNFGAIGAVIGHEIGHGFDDQGSRYDGTGNLVDWWTAEDRQRFEERTRSLIDQFDVLVPAGFESKHTVNGALTIGENIGDVGGLSIAYKALTIAAADEGREVTTEEKQQFFYAWAKAWRIKMRKEERLRRLSVDPHSPEEFRCNQVVKNIDAFAEAFDVSEGDPMYLPPEERVHIWV